MVDWPITFECNNNCISCIYDMDKMSFPTPNAEEIKKVIDSISPEGILCMTGGEPTIRKEFLSFLKYAKKRNPNMNIFVVTNGRMFYYKKFVEKTVSVGLRNLRIGIAIYGHNEKVHDSITRISGSFKQTVKGAENLISKGIPVELRVIVNRMNYKNLENISNYITEKLSGTSRVVFINMKYTGNAYKNRKLVFVNYKDLVPYAERAADSLMKKNIDVRFFHFPFCTIKKKYWKIAKGVTKQKRELMFVKTCKKCKVKEECPMIWKGYWALAGEDEFKAITNP